MSNQAIYPEGIRVFAPHPNSPDFVLGTMIITIDQLHQWAQQYAKESQYGRQIKLDIVRPMNGDKPFNLKLNTYEPQQQQQQPQQGYPQQYPQQPNQGYNQGR